MNYDFTSEISEETRHRIQTGDFSSETLQKLQKQCQQTMAKIQGNIAEVQAQFINDRPEQTIYEFQLDNIEKFLRLMQTESWFAVDTDDLSKKVMKFLSPEFDLTPTQLRTLKILNYLYCQHLPITLTDLEIFLRVLRASWNNPTHFEQAFNVLRFRMGYLDHGSRDKLDENNNIVKFIQQCNSMDVLYDLMLKDLDVNRYMSCLLELVYQHTSIYNSFIKNHKSKGTHFSLEFQEAITRKIIKPLDILQFDQFNQTIVWDINSHGIQGFAEYYALPLIKIDMASLYKDSYPVKFELTQLQEQVSHKFYNSSLLDMFIGLFEGNQHEFVQNRQSRFNVHEAIKIITMMASHLDTDDFESKVVPFIKFRLDNKQYFLPGNFQPETTLILRFIHAHSDEPYIHSAFFDIFCKHQIFDQIIKQVENAGKNICFQKTVQKWDRGLQTDNLFWLLVTSFELIKICKLTNGSFRQLSKILSNSIEVVRQNKTEEWQMKLLERMMTEMNQRESQRMPQMNRSWMFWDRSLYQADF